MATPMNATLNTKPEDDESRPQRETAQRLFAAEFNASTLEHKDGGERSPTYIITRLGAKVNRLFFVGVLTQKEPVGQGGDMWRATILDPTGSFNVYAGQYQPEAAQALQELEPPAVVAVVGKSRTYQPEEGVTYTSVRPETVTRVDVDDRDRWILETAELSIARLDAVREALKLEKPDAAAIEKLGYPADVAEGVARALAAYGPPDPNAYATMVKDALESLMPGAKPKEPTPIPPAPSATPDFKPAAGAAPAPAPAPAPGAPPAAAPAAAKPAAPVPAADPAVQEREDFIAELCTELDDGKGAPWEDIVAAAAKKQITEEQVEESLNALMDKGVIYEPVLGRLKKT